MTGVAQTTSDRPERAIDDIYGSTWWDRTVCVGCG